MITNINRTITFNEFDLHYLNHVIDMLTDIDNIMLEDATDGDDYRSCRQIDMIDAETAEVIAIRSEIEDVAMMLSNLCIYIAENVNRNKSVICKDVGEYPSFNDFDIKQHICYYNGGYGFCPCPPKSNELD